MLIIIIVVVAAVVVPDDLNTSIIFAVYVYVHIRSDGGIDSSSRFRGKILMIE